MNSSLRSIFLISITAFLLLELGFYLEGFLQFLLFSVVTIILFIMLFFFYGYVKETQKKKSNKILLFAALLLLPLISIAFNPTHYFNNNKIHESQIILLAWQHPDEVLENESSCSITLLKNGTYRIKEFGFWMNSVETGKYEIEGRLIYLKKGRFIKTLKMKRFYKDQKLYVINKGKIDFKENFLIEHKDEEFIKELKAKKKES